MVYVKAHCAGFDVDELFCNAVAIIFVGNGLPAVSINVLVVDMVP